MYEWVYKNSVTVYIRMFYWNHSWTATTTSLLLNLWSLNRCFSRTVWPAGLLKSVLPLVLRSHLSLIWCATFTMCYHKMSVSTSGELWLWQHVFFVVVLFCFNPMPPHVRHGLRGLPPGCGWSVTDFWGWDAHEAWLHCPNEVDGDIWVWSTRRGLKTKFY
jgi:hypothetical protein